MSPKEVPEQPVNWLVFGFLIGALTLALLFLFIIPTTHSQSPQVAYVRNVDEHLDIITINGVEKAAYDFETVNAMLIAQKAYPKVQAAWDKCEGDRQLLKDDVQKERVRNGILSRDFQTQSDTLKETAALLKNTSGGKLGGLLNNPWFRFGETIARDSLLTAQVIKCK